MTTYYHRRNSDGEIINASEIERLSLAEIEKRWPLTDAYYDPNPPLEVLKRYRYWNERP